MPLKKYVKLGANELVALALILVATLLRVLLVGLHWPLFNSDEGTMGLMALHIASHGEHPLFYYGQNYMGTLDAYLGAGLFRVLGPSILALRWSMLLLYVPFMGAMYCLTRLLYSHTLALASLVVLSLGSIPLLNLEVRPIVYADILCFGACAFLLSCWLTLSSKQDGVQPRAWWRLLGYACWGGVAGLGIWSDLLILPYVVSAALLLVVFCGRELLFKGGGPCLLLGLLVGASPLLLYNLTAPAGQDSLSIFVAQAHPVTAAPGSVIPFSRHLVNTLVYNIPDATGNPLCLYAQGPLHTLGLPCALGLASWSVGLIVLWLVALWLALRALWKYKQGVGGQPASSEHQRRVMREGARLMLLVSAGITVVVFTLSAASIPSSAVLARYLHCLLISVPAVMWPLWRGASKIEPSAAVRARLNAAVCRGLLLLILLVFLTGTLAAFGDVPSVRKVEQQREALILKLERMKITHFYTDDYWTCYRMAFASHEQLSCAVIEADLRPSGANRNRYWPYVVQVQADPQRAYVLLANDPHTPSIVRKAHLADGKYLRIEVDGYVIYQSALL